VQSEEISRESIASGGAGLQKLEERSSARERVIKVLDIHLRSLIWTNDSNVMTVLRERERARKSERERERPAIGVLGYKSGSNW